MEMEESNQSNMREERTDLKPYIFSIFCNICYAGLNIIAKVSLDQGMSRYVLVAYGHAFGTLATALLALLFERNNESKISVSILRNIFLLGLVGALLRTLYYAGMEYTSPTFASAMGNLLPSITFILAIFCRMEKLDIGKQSGQAKIGGTLVSFAGATVMTLYKGIVVISLHTRGSHHTSTSKSKVFLDGDWIKGSLMLLLSNLLSAIFYILQRTTIKMYPAPITLTSLTCLAGTVVSTIVTAILDHKASSWKLCWDITLVAPLYSGIMIFGITGYIQTLVVRKKGPVFVTAFRPLATVIVAIMGLLILRDALHLGDVMGATMIIVGLYAILWGKEDEKEKIAALDQSMAENRWT